jgi:hypothetical protein
MEANLTTIDVLQTYTISLLSNHKSNWEKACSNIETEFTNDEAHSNQIYAKKGTCRQMDALKQANNYSSFSPPLKWGCFLCPRYLYVRTTSY